MPNAFLTLYTGLSREGPGDEASLHNVLKVAGTKPDARVLDAACGSGADTVTLLSALPKAHVLAVDKYEHFISQAKKRIEPCDRCDLRVGDMLDVEGDFDLIWCAGAVYFKGVELALNAWRNHLTDGGRIAFSDAVWLTDTPPKPAQDFWMEYPEMTDIDGVKTRIEAAGFKVLSAEVLGREGWETYYDSLETRALDLRKGPVDAELAQVLQGALDEVAIFREHGDVYDYAIFVAESR